MHFLSAAILCVLGMLFSACSTYENEDLQEQPLKQKVVIAMFSPDGLGDRGYNDQVLYGLETVHKNRDDCVMLRETPQTAEEAELIFVQWLERKSRGILSMFILASTGFEEMLGRVLNSQEYDMTDKAILLFETETEFFHPQVFTFKINMYGACYLAGLCVAAMGLNSPLIMLGSSADSEIYLAANGFTDGYKEATGKTPALDFYADDWSGYVMSQKAYEMMSEMSKNYDFIFPVAGGTNLGIYRYLREYPEGPLVAGMDIDQSRFSNNVIGSMIKHIDRLVVDGITLWLDNPVNDQNHIEFGLDSGYIEWQLSDRFKEYSSIVEENLQKAIEREQKQ